MGFFNSTFLGAKGQPVGSETATFFQTICPNGESSSNYDEACPAETWDLGGGGEEPEPEADLSVKVTRVEESKVIGPTGPVPGTSVQYSIVFTNTGDGDEFGVQASALWPQSLLNAQHGCDASDGASCDAKNKVAGGLNQFVDLPANSSVTFSLTGTIDASAVGSFEVSATIPQGQNDPNPQNNSALLSETLAPEADISVKIKRAFAEPGKEGPPEGVVPGTEVTYSIYASNEGPSNSPANLVAIAWPEFLGDVSWDCETSEGGSCSPDKGSVTSRRRSNWPRKATLCTPLPAWSILRRQELSTCKPPSP